MKKRLFIRTSYKRRNYLQYLITSRLSIITDKSRMLLEPFLRKHMGARYFSFSNCLLLTLFLAVVPIGIEKLSAWYHSFITGSPFYFSNNGRWLLWYGFLICHLLMALKRKSESRPKVSEFDTSAHSLDLGSSHTWLSSLHFPGLETTPRRIEILYEPALFFLPGILLMLLGNPLGWLLVIASIGYSVSYIQAYAEGDNSVYNDFDKVHGNSLTRDILTGFEPDAQKPNTRFSRNKPSSGSGSCGGEDDSTYIAE